MKQCFFQWYLDSPDAFPYIGGRKDYTLVIAQQACNQQHRMPERLGWFPFLIYLTAGTDIVSAYL